MPNRAEKYSFFHEVPEPKLRPGNMSLMGRSPGGECILSPPQSQLLSFLGGSRRACLKCAVCLFWRADLCL